MFISHPFQRRSFGRMAAIILLFATSMLLFTGVQPVAAGTTTSALSQLSQILEPGLLDAAVKAWMKGKKVPIIVQFSSQPKNYGLANLFGQLKSEAARHGVEVKAAGATLKQSYVYMPSVSAMADPATLLKFLLNPRVVRVSIDRNLTLHMATTDKAVGADQVWAGADGIPGLNGEGVTVAVIDSGISSSVDLNANVVGALDFTDDGTAVDGYGHGVHVAGIIAGQGIASAPGSGYSEQYKGCLLYTSPSPRDS